MTVNKEDRQDKIWHFFQTSQPEAFAGSDSRVKFLVGKVRPGERCLNIGVGTGMFEERALAKGIDVHSLDPIEQTIRALERDYGVTGKAKIGYSQEIPFESDTFDVVVISEVLEHLENDILTDTVREVKRVLRPGGRVLGTVPANEDLGKQSVVCPGCGLHFHRWGHHQSFTRQELMGLLNPELSVREIVQRPFFGFGQLNWKGKLSAGLRWVLFRFGVHGSNENLFFVAHKTCD